MTEYLLAFDKDLFYTIINGFSNSFFDVLMPFLREKTNWKIVAVEKVLHQATQPIILV